MQKIQKWFKSLKTYLIVDPKKLLIRISIWVLLYTIFMMIDRLTKQLIFTSQDYQTAQTTGFYNPINWGIIGFRPVVNNGAAFSSFIGHYTFLQTIGILVAILTTFMIFIKIDLKFLIPIILIGAGALGNVIDRFIYDGYVRDLLYFPWWTSYATFNFADSFVIIDSLVLLCLILIDIIKGTPQREVTGKVA